MICRSFGTCAIVLLALPAAAAQLDTRELLRCHAIAAKDERLDCYEALAASAASTASGAAPAQAAHSVAPPAPAAVAGVAAPATTPVDPNDPANFGLSRHQIEPHPPAEASSIKSVVSQMTEDRRHNITVVLDNGQTWAFIEPEPRLRPGDTVTIKHASLGSFLMLTPSRRSYRVERVK